MEYKTVIEIVTEANSTAEAADIAGDYLRGHLDTGVFMKCCTKRIKNYTALKISAFLVVLFCFLSLTSQTKSDMGISYHTDTSFSNINTIQPPLKTGMADEYFRDKWQAEENSVVLSQINQ